MRRSSLNRTQGIVLGFCIFAVVHNRDALAFLSPKKITKITNFH